jgi:hypothetical protein
MLKHLPLVITNLAIVWVAANSQNFAVKTVESTFGPVTPAPAVAPAVPPAAVPVAAPVADPIVLDKPRTGYLASLRAAYEQSGAISEPVAATPTPSAPKTVPALPALPAGPNLKGLPKFIQTLDSNQYAAWVVWQNEQAKARSASGYRDDMWNYGLETTVDSTGSSRASGFSRGSSCKNGNVTSKRGTTGGSSYSEGHVVARSYGLKFLNSDYTAPAPVVVYNPWVTDSGRSVGPDWSALYVPCPDGVVRTVTAALTLVGPVDPELLFAECMRPYFGGN